MNVIVREIDTIVRKENCNNRLCKTAIRSDGISKYSIFATFLVDHIVFPGTLRPNL